MHYELCALIPDVVVDQSDAEVEHRSQVLLDSIGKDHL